MSSLKWHYYPKIHADFQRNTPNHELQVLHEDGLHRHLRFREPGTMMWHFDIITWPGYLAVVGDIADGYIFSRTTDMLEFFDDGQPDGHINASYWAEKLAHGANDVKQFSNESFTSWLTERLNDMEPLPADVEDLKSSARHAESVEQAIDVLNDHDISWDYEDPSCWLDYKYQFILALHAILWGAKKYHAIKAEGAKQ